MKDYSEERDRIITVKEMSPDDQPREKALKHGCQSLATPDLWALILRTGLQGKPITELCRDLMRYCNGSLFVLERLERQQLMNVDGIGPTKALQIEAVMELIRRYNNEKVGDKVRFKDASDIYRFMRPQIGNLPHEEVWAIYLDRKNEVISHECITRGSSVASIFDIKKILKQALIYRAEGLAMCHNHPSGNLNSSPQDDNITRKLSDGCKAVDLRFLDHVIVTATDYYSYASNGRI